jgi:tetratricopeptide (TPR) repeat protein
VARFHFEIARQCEYPLGDLARAAEEYQRAIALRSDHVPSIRGARRVLLRLEQTSQAIQWFDAEIRLVAKPERRAALYLQKAECLAKLNRDTEIPKTLAAAAELVPTDIGVLQAMVLSERRTGNHASLDRALAQLVDAVSTDSTFRAVLLAERARVSEIVRKDTKTAIELYRGALVADVHAVGVIAALERLYYAEGRFNELAEVTTLAAEQANTAQGRALSYQRLALVLLERLGRIPEGVTALERAHAELPNDVALLEDLVAAYERANQPRKLAAALERLYALSADGRGKVGLAYRIGRIYEEALHDDVHAAKWLTKELERDPLDLAALDALEALYVKHNQWKQLVQMRLAEAEACQDGPRRAALLCRVARVVENKLGSAEEATKIYARAVATDPSYAPAFSSLDRLLCEASRYADVIKLYEQAVDASSDPEEKAIGLFKIGRIEEDILRNPRAAYAAYERIVGTGHVQVEALHAMQRTAERGQLWNEYVRALEQEAAVTKDTPRKLSLLQRAAEVVAEELVEVDSAASRYRKVLELDAKYEPSLQGLSALLYRAGRWDDWLSVQKRHLQALSNATSRLTVHYDMGRVLDERLGHRAEAILAYREVLTINPHHQLAQLALERLLSAEERWADLVEIHEKVASGAEPALVARRLTRAAEILEHRLAKPDLAQSLLEKVLAVAPDYTRAVQGRLRLLAQARSPKLLAEGYAALAASAPSTQDGRLAAYREAEVRRDELSQPDKAVHAFEGVVQVEPKHLAAWIALEELESALGNWSKVPSAITAQVGLLADPVAKVAALNRLSFVLGRLGQSSKELEVLVLLLEIDPNNVLALEQLEQIALSSNDTSLISQVDQRLAALADDPRVAAAHQTRWAEALENDGDIAALDGFLKAYERDREDVAAARGIGRLAIARRDVARIELAADAELLTTHELEIASGLLLYSSQLRSAAGDIDGAIQIAAKALGIHPDSDACLDRITELRLKHNQVEPLIAEVAHAAGRVKSKERAAVLWIRVAHILADVKKDVAGAIAALSRVTQAQPNHVEAWLEMGDLYVRDGQLSVAVERYRKVLEAHASPEQQLLARLAMGTILVELGNAAQALEHLQAVLSIQPGEPKALKALLEVRLQRGETEVAAGLAAQLIEHAPTVEEQANALVALGRIERQRRRPTEAIAALAKAVAVSGVQGRAAEELMGLLSSLKSEGRPADYGTLVTALTYFIENRAEPGPNLVAASALLARVLERELGQAEQAVPYLERAIQLAPEDTDLLALLANVLERAGRYPAAVEAYRSLLRYDANLADAYRGISRSLAHLGRSHESAQALSPLVILGGASEAESAIAASRVILSAPLPARSLSTDLLDVLGSPMVVDPIGNLITTMADGLDRSETVDIERFGLSSRDKLNARSGHPLRVVADRVANASGIEDFELFVATSGVTNVVVTTTDPPSLIVPARLLEVPESVQIFAFARIFTLMSRRWHACDQFDGPALQQWFMAALRLADSSYGSGTPQDEMITIQAKRLAKALPWGRRGRVEEAAQSCLGINPIAVEDFRLRARWAAARLSCLLSDDLTGAVSWLRQTEGEHSGHPAAQAAFGTALVEELLRTWVMEPSNEIRRRVGVLV